MTETEEKLAQLTQELSPLCSIAAKPVIVKIEELFLAQEKDKQNLVQHGIEQGIQISSLEHGKKAFIEWLEDLNQTDTTTHVINEIINKAKEAL